MDALARIVVAICVGAVNTGVLALFTDAPEWGLWAMYLVTSTIVIWSTVGE